METTGPLHLAIVLRVPKDLSNEPGAIAKVSRSLASRLDPEFASVPLTPATSKLAVSLAADQERLVLVRGQIDEERIREILSHRSVVKVYLDPQVFPYDDPSAVAASEWWLVDRGESPNVYVSPPVCDCNPAEPHGCLLDVATLVGADQVWQDGIQGDDIVVGVVDGGILAEERLDPDLPGLVPRVAAGWPSADWGTVAAWRHHGCMVAIDVLGIAPRASVYDIRIVDPSSGISRIADATAGLHWALERFRATGTPQVLCCGWGLCQHAQDPAYATDATHPLTQKVVEAIDEGMLVLFAAGNGGEQCSAAACGQDVGPGKSIWGANGHPRVMTVAAANHDRQRIGYSSQGPAALDEFKPDFCGLSHFAGYFPSDSGTSAACAVAAGVVALLKQAQPTLTQQAAKRLLTHTARPVGPQAWDHDFGFGIIQAKAAYDELVGGVMED